MKAISEEKYLAHFGILGMKWGVRRTPAQLGHTPGMSSTTKKVINNYNKMSDDEFKSKYQTSKKTYAKRVKKYGDPYMNSPLAKFGKKKEEEASIKRGKAKAKSILEQYGDKYPVTVDEKGIVSIKIGDDLWKVGY